MTICEPKPFTPSDTASGNDGKFPTYVVVEIQLKNSSDKPYSPGGTLMTSATSGDQETGKVFDVAQGIDFPSSSPGPNLCCWLDEAGG